MGKEIKIRLLMLNKKQTDLLLLLHERGFPKLDKSQLSSYINGVIISPQSEKVLKIVEETLDKWEKMQNVNKRQN